MTAAPESAQEDPLARLQGESERAHQGFLDYFALGPDRTLKKLYEKYVLDSNRPPSQYTINHWSKVWRWSERLRRVSTLHAHNTVELLTDAHASAVEAYRADLEKSGQKIMHSALKMYELVESKLDQMTSQDITPSDLPGYLRVMLQAIQVGAEIRAQSLGLETVMMQLKENQSIQQTGATQ